MRGPLRNLTDLANVGQINVVSYFIFMALYLISSSLQVRKFAFLVYACSSTY